MQQFRPDNYNAEEEKKLRQADKVWKKVIMMVDCLHHNTLVHTNGDQECLRCGKIWKFKKKE